METSILSVDAHKIGVLTAVPRANDVLDELSIDLDLDSEDAQNLVRAAEQLRASNIPVAFPTETVYGLGADATRSAAVKGIYAAKQRPSDNPLIVHFASLSQLRSLLRPSVHATQNGMVNGEKASDPIPDIYMPLISKYWPGPLTILLPVPRDCSLAPEVTAGLKTFGARIPRHLLALALIQLAGVPIAAPSANASTKPSPTAAEHVAFDLDGRIETIIDGGPCDVGLESTVVDGLSQPPLILRPGGISLDQIRTCPGWEHTEVGYDNVSEKAGQPKAPGMKYRHYSPKATVILYEAGRSIPTLADLEQRCGSRAKIGLICTRTWAIDNDGSMTRSESKCLRSDESSEDANGETATGVAGLLRPLERDDGSASAMSTHRMSSGAASFDLYAIDLGSRIADIARGIFSSLRSLDREGVEAILVEGIDDRGGDTAAAIMNRLRKAAEVRIDG